MQYPPAKDVLLQSSFSELIRGWIHTEAQFKVNMISAFLKIVNTVLIFYLPSHQGNKLLHQI